MLRRHGVEPIAWYGVRLFTESWARDRPAVDPVDEVLAVELEASRRDPYRQLSRLFHLLGTKRGTRLTGAQSGSGSEPSGLARTTV